MKSWVDINDDLCGTYNANSQINFKLKILQSILNDYNSEYILFRGNMSVAALVVWEVKGDKKKAYRNCVSFTNFIGEIKNIQVDNAKDIYVAMQRIN